MSIVSPAPCTTRQTSAGTDCPNRRDRFRWSGSIPGPVEKVGLRWQLSLARGQVEDGAGHRKIQPVIRTGLARSPNRDRQNKGNAEDDGTCDDESFAGVRLEVYPAGIGCPFS